MDEMIGPMSAQIDQQKLAQQLVESARREGVELVGPDFARGSQAQLIYERAVQRGIDVRRHPRSGAVLTFGDTSHRFHGGNTRLNSPLARRATNQKEVASRLLRHAGTPALDNAVFSDVDRAWAWAEPVLPVVVKPNAATKGTLVHIGVADRATFADASR